MGMIAVADIGALQYQGKTSDLRDGRKRGGICRRVTRVVSTVTVSTITGPFVKLTITSPRLFSTSAVHVVGTPGAVVAAAYGKWITSTLARWVNCVYLGPLFYDPQADEHDEVVEVTVLDEGSRDSDVHYTDDDGTDVGDGSMVHDGDEVIPIPVHARPCSRY